MTDLLNLAGEYGLYIAIPLAFLALVAWIYRPGAKRMYKADGNIPFHEDR
jgi:cbb3-type cytochrome oxidase subunit 3